jgi:hypothetical protein
LAERNLEDHWEIDWRTDTKTGAKKNLTPTSLPQKESGTGKERELEDRLEN